VRNDGTAWKVIVVEPCLSWLQEMRWADHATLIQIGQAITALAKGGPGLGRPLLNTVPGSRLPNLRELRSWSRGRAEVRLLLIVDPYRHAVFLAAGSKSGKWPNWRKTAIGQAENAYADYLRNDRTGMSQPPGDGPAALSRDDAARSWDDLATDFGFSAAEERQISQGADQLLGAVRARRLVAVRKRQNVTQVEVAAVLGVSQARVSRIENGQLGRPEVDILAAYVRALGGKLRVIADFGDEIYVLG
jgi:predicted XRE-type DNA-binding protein